MKPIMAVFKPIVVAPLTVKLVVDQATMECECGWQLWSGMEVCLICKAPNPIANWKGKTLEQLEEG